MLSYLTASKLKESGFPSGKDNEDYYEEFRDWIPPTLSELIESCDKDGIFLWKFKDDWCATRIDPSYDCFSDDFIDDHFSPKKGHSPEEAVANLWLALQSK